MNVVSLFLDAGPAAGARRVLVLSILPALLLVGTLRFDFVFDDNLVILSDPLITGRLDLQKIFSSEVRVADVSLGYYRPLTTLLYRFDVMLWGQNPAGYHLTNLLWHVAATLLVYWVAHRTTGAILGAWAAALLFAVLPAHAEAIGWIQGRVDLVSTSLCLAALLALIRHREAAAGPHWRWAAAAAVTFFAALLTKESVAALPIAWLMWEAVAAPQGSWRRNAPAVVVRLGSLIVAGLVYGLLRWHAVGGAITFPVDFTPVGLRFLALLSVLAEYGRVLVFPSLALNFFHALTVGYNLRTTAIGLTVLLVLGGGLLATWRWARPVFPWFVWIPIMLSPSLIFVLYASAPDTGFLVADRFLYLPSIGWCMLLGALIDRASNGRETNPSWAGLLTLGGLIVGYSGLLLIRLMPWADAADLLVAMKGQAALATPTRVFVHAELGRVYLERNEFQAARAELQVALRIRPDHPLAHNNMGVLLIREGRPAEALPWLERAIRLDPTYRDAYGNLGAAHETIGDLSAARRAYQNGLRMVPDSAWLSAGLDRVTQAIERTPPHRRNVLP